MLNQQQIDRFKQTGVLIIRNFFTDSEIKRWRQETHDYFAQPQSADDWFHALLKIPCTPFHLHNEPTPNNHPKLKALYQSLADIQHWQGDNELVARSPEIDAEWLGARTPHLDYPVYAPLRTLANNIFYLADVCDTGAPFMYWPGSHLVAWEYFKQHPEDYMSQGNRSQDQVFARITARMTNQPIPFAAKAGDLMIWHALLLHSPSVNISHSARLAIIGRWGNAIQPQEARFDFNQSPWQHWAFNKESVTCA